MPLQIPSLSKTLSPSSRSQSQRYSRIPMITKRRLIKRVLQEGMSIKEVTVIWSQAAQQLRINYSTAKTILFLFRRRHNPTLIVKQEHDSTEEYSQSIGHNIAGWRLGQQSIEVVGSIGGITDENLSHSSHKKAVVVKGLSVLWFCLILNLISY